MASSQPSGVRASRLDTPRTDFTICAALLIKASEDLYTVGEVLGHPNIQTTKRYAHLELSRKRAALDKVGLSVAGIAPEKKNATENVALKA